jgi:hypothetical protein
MDRRTSAVVSVVLALVSIAPAASQAATFNVNTPADISAPGGCVTAPACSLRDATTAANASLDAEDRIEIPSGNYAISSGKLELTGGPVTIHGAGARTTTIDANGTSRVFELAAQGVAIEGLTITGGATSLTEMTEFAGDGGGILVASGEQLTLNQVAVVGNTATQNGGGISAPPESGTATTINVNASAIAANKVTGGAAEGLGGGIYTLGNLSIVNSTIAGNSVDNAIGTNQGGGVLAGLDPANTAGSSATVLNSTITGNSVSAGGIGGGLTVYNPVVGVVTALSVKNTIVAANTVAGAPGDCGTVAAITSVNNLSSDASCMFTDPGSKQNANPLLGALANNGGPTDTLALPAGSPALDAGANTGCPTTDQRGVSRPQGPACDIGAFEREVVAPAPPTTADLRLKLKAKPKHPKPGHKLTFLMTVLNRGPAAAPGAIVKGAVPAATRKIKGKKVSGKGPCKLKKAKKGKRQFTCRLGTLAAGKTAKLKILVKPRTAGKLRARAQVRSGAPDPQMKNNRAKASAKVKGG